MVTFFFQTFISSPHIPSPLSINKKVKNPTNFFNFTSLKKKCLIAEDIIAEERDVE
jgi:hypothetical protein